MNLYSHAAAAGEGDGIDAGPDVDATAAGPYADEGRLEIERKFLLDRLPNLPPAAQAIEIEQGYLPGSTAAAGARMHGGRLRRSVYADGREHYTHTVKRGSGLVRREIERALTREHFERLWPQTLGRRLRKRRYAIREGELTWEIDAIGDLGLTLAEVELPCATAAHVFPPWLGPHVLREVTDDPAYTNAALAVRGAPHPP